MEKVFLIGNPNVGKSVVFSRLTGLDVIVSNYPGTTVGISRGQLKIDDRTIEVVDLPGTYSLEPTSEAENVAVSMLSGQPLQECTVVNVVDATNLERNLYLTLQLIEKGCPLVVCLNMFDETKHRGIAIDVAKLEALLGVPVIPTCAVTGVGIKALIERFGRARPLSVTARTNQDRWQEIGRIVEAVQQLSHRHHTLRELFEDASISPFSGPLVAAAILFASFKVVRFVAESLIATVFDPLFDTVFRPALETLSAALGSGSFLHHILIGELIDGKIDFRQSMGLLTTAPYIEFDMVLPYIISFYFVLSFLEDMGFLPRLAVLLDSIFHRIGLHGYAIIPVLLGFGCNVPGILSTRMLESKRERFIVSTLISIGVPCVPLQAMIVGLLGRYSGFYVAGVYLVLFSLWLILGVVMNRFSKGYSPEFLIEIPPYRLPPLTLLFKKVMFRIKGFLVEALPIVLAGVLLVNILLYYRAFGFVTGIFGPFLKWAFGLPQEAVVSLVIGFVRKDVAVGMLAPLHLTVKQLFISATLLAISFPCIATFIVLLKELGIKALVKSTLIMLATGLAVGMVLNFAMVF